MEAFEVWFERQDRRHFVGIALLIFIGTVLGLDPRRELASWVWAAAILMPFFIQRKLIWLTLLAWGLYFGYWVFQPQKGSPFVNAGLCFACACLLIAARSSYRKENRPEV